jgi:hypothetical protein
MRLGYDLLNVEWCAQSGIEFGDAGFNFRSQFGEQIYALKDFAAKLLLGGLGQGRHFVDRKLQDLNHDEKYHKPRQRAAALKAYALTFSRKCGNTSLSSEP